MKKNLLSVLLFLSCATVVAQPRGGDPKYDPDYNPYEKVLDDTARGKRTARFLKNLYPPEVWKDKFESSPCNDYVVLADARIKQFKDFVTKFQSMPVDPKQMKLAEANQKKMINDVKKRVLYQWEYLEKVGTFASDDQTPIENLLCRTKGSVQTFKNSLAYLEEVKKFYPEIPDIDESIRISKEGIAKYGDNKSLLASIKKNKNAELAEVYMPKAVTQNAEWEGWFKTWFAKEYPGHTIVKQSLLSANWYIKKNEISGLPEYRHLGTAIGAKSPDGKCKIIPVDLYQDYLGGKFESSGRYETGREKEMLCENLK